MPPVRGLALQAVPNPFNPVTIIRLDLPTGDAAEVRVFDLAGREVWHYYLEAGTAGTREVTWEGRDSGGSLLASGVYFAHVKQGRQVSACKVTLLK